jgi:hypothetical protein
MVVLIIVVMIVILVTLIIMKMKIAIMIIIIVIIHHLILDLLLEIEFHRFFIYDIFSLIIWVTIFKSLCDSIFSFIF